MPSGQPAPTAEKMVIYTPREVTVERFNGDGGVGETTRFLCRIERVWERQHLKSDKERVAFLCEKIENWRRVESEKDSHLEGRASISDQVLDIIRKCYGEKRNIPALKRAFLNTKQRLDEESVAFHTGL